MLPKELHQLKYEAISVPQGSVRLVKKTQERKSSTCYLLITKGVTSSSPEPPKTRRVNAYSVNILKKYLASGHQIDCHTLDAALKPFMKKVMDCNILKKSRSNSYNFRKQISSVRIDRHTSKKREWLKDGPRNFEPWLIDEDDT
ncbi:uncharacterized protein TNCV_56751 [Trichonephila clavipes]|nr:uncharacterized protein TNCV_56751 [Trichonephila clavipes]